jgi:hypothetical protein
MSLDACRDVRQGGIPDSLRQILTKKFAVS